MTLSIYVDPMAPTPRSGQWRWDQGCHLFHADHDCEALDSFALSISMQLHWRHNTPGFPHYDLHHRHRAAAIQAGAIAIDRHHPVMVEMFRRRRQVLAALAAVRNAAGTDHP